MRPPASKPSRAMRASPRSRSIASSRTRRPCSARSCTARVSSARETMQATLVRARRRRRQVLLDLVERMYLGATEPEDAGAAAPGDRRGRCAFPNWRSRSTRRTAMCSRRWSSTWRRRTAPGKLHVPDRRTGGGAAVDPGLRRRALLHLQAARRPRGAPRLGRRHRRSGDARAGRRRPPARPARPAQRLKSRPARAMRRQSRRVG